MGGREVKSEGADGKGGKNDTGAWGRCYERGFKKDACNGINSAKTGSGIRHLRAGRPWRVAPPWLGPSRTRGLSILPHANFLVSLLLLLPQPVLLPLPLPLPPPPTSPSETNLPSNEIKQNPRRTEEKRPSRHSPAVVPPARRVP